MPGRAIRLTVMLFVVLALQGCREDEQDRVLRFEPGTYLGQPDEPLDEQQIEELRRRATQQQF